MGSASIPWLTSSPADTEYLLLPGRRVEARLQPVIERQGLGNEEPEPLVERTKGATPRKDQGSGYSRFECRRTVNSLMATLPLLATGSN